MFISSYATKFQRENQKEAENNQNKINMFKFF